MTEQPEQPSFPIEVRFNGCEADESIIDLCTNAARCLGRDVSCPGSCTVEISREAHSAEIWIVLESAAEKCALARVLPAADVPELRRTLSEALDRMTRWLGESHAHRPRVVPSVRPDSVEDMSRSCYWYG
jgi:hypothetical protein